MTETTSKMICPRCGLEMNHHSDKLVYATDPRQLEKADLVVGGLIEEFHTCPKCGGVASRHA